MHRYSSILTSLLGIVFLPVMLSARQDGCEWNWVHNRDPWIPFGRPGSYCSTGIVPLHKEPFVVGDELLICFNAFSRSPDKPCPFGARTIGVAKLRRDGFAGLTVADGDTHGTLTTRPITVKGDVLQINVEQRGEGQVKVALLDEAGKIIPGFDFDESTPITRDAIRAHVNWKNAFVRSLSNRRVRVRLRISGGAVLYAMTLR